MKKIAIILSGCGNRDGSELQETLSLLLAIDRRNWQYQCFAPQDQFTVISHLDGNPTTEKRDILVESARIARGNILPLSQYNPLQFNALALPGGMGAARNLSSYASLGPQMTVRDDVAQAILQTYQAHKPILALCIAPVILASLLGKQHIQLTLGHQGPAAQNAEKMGAIHVNCNATDVCVDHQNLILTTPAYMVATRISQIFQGTENLIAELEKILSPSAS